MNCRLVAPGVFRHGAAWLTRTPGKLVPRREPACFDPLFLRPEPALVRAACLARPPCCSCPNDTAILCHMHLQIRRISTSSAFLVGMALHGLIGFLVGIGLAVIAGVDVPAGTEPSFVQRLGAWAIIVVPFVYGVGGGLVTAIAATLYNAVAAVVGGLRIELRAAGRPGRSETDHSKHDDET